MVINFTDRRKAKALINLGYFSLRDEDLISISDTNKEKKEIRDMWMSNKKDSNAAIFLNFEDVDGIESGLTESKAKQIIKFAEKSHKKKKNITIHCFAGISRSGAVAKFINEYFMEGNEYLENYQGHNRYVYYTLLETAGIQTMRSYYKELES